MDSLTDCDRVYAIVPETLGAVCLLDGDTAHILFAEAFGDAWNDILCRLFDGTLSLVLHDAKATVRALLQRGMDPKGIVFDTAIAAYLLDPTQSGYDLPRLALAYCNAELPELDLDDPAALSPLGGREETGCAPFTPRRLTGSSSLACESCTTKSSCRSCACWLRWKRRAVRLSRMSCVPSVTSWTCVSAT